MDTLRLGQAAVVVMVVSGTTAVVSGIRSGRDALLGAVVVAAVSPAYGLLLEVLWRTMMGRGSRHSGYDFFFVPPRAHVCPRKLVDAWGLRLVELRTLGKARQGPGLCERNCVGANNRTCR